MTSDDRNLTELESVHRDPVKPKFVKEIKEELVDSPDIPDVEVRRVFVEGLRALLVRLRGEEVPDSADDGDSKGGKR